MKRFGIVVTLILVGCSTVPYPQEWAAIDTNTATDQCVPITGRFSQQGIVQKNKGALWNRVEGPELSWLSELLGIDSPPKEAVTHLSLRISTVDPNLTIWGISEQLLTRSIKPGELSCESGVWNLELDWSAWRVGGVVMPVGASFISLELRRAVDGAIVISRKKTYSGTLFFYVYYKVQNWHRFSPVSEITQSPPRLP